MAKTFKHLTLDNRITILTEIKRNTSLNEIAKKTKKDPTTISKEVKLHRYLKENKLPPFYSKSYVCSEYEKCTLKGLCRKINCDNSCKFCKNINCTKECKQYKYKTCKRLQRFPYVCNGCEKVGGCKLNHYFYDPQIADKEYEKTLVESRTGINTDTPSFDKINEIIKDGVKKGKSIYTILLSHPEINKSERTIYRYISKKYLGIDDIDLRNKVKMKLRIKKCKETREFLANIRENRRFNDYVNFITKNPSVHGAQLDLVIGKKGESKCILTVIFPFSNLMLGFLLPNKAADTIVEAINKLESILGLNNFKRMFPYLLTDRGNEFSKATEIETSLNGESRTKLFYCDAYSSSQKAQIERNHQFIRFFYPQGTSFSNLTQEKLDLMLSHINSYPREAKNNYSPYDIASIIFGSDILDSLNIKKILFDDIILNKTLLK